jgi:lysophospholipase L1-like esterase
MFRVAKPWPIAADRVYAIGMSSGAFETSILGAEFPDLYAAIGIHSGAAFKRGMVGCLETGYVPLLSTATLAREAYAAEGPRARVMPVILFHGDADTTIPYQCGQQALAQWLDTDNSVLSAAPGTPIDTTPSSTVNGTVSGGHAYTVDTYTDAAGCAIAQLWTVHGMNHFWSGGSGDPASARFTDPKGPSAAAASWAFFAARRMSIGAASSCSAPQAPGGSPSHAERRRSAKQSHPSKRTSRPWRAKHAKRAKHPKRAAPKRAAPKRAAPKRLACAGHWVGSWAAAPSGGSLTRPVLDHQKLRMIIAPHLDGNSVRIHLSNRFGLTPVRLGPVTLADEAAGAAVVPSTVVPLTFRGHSTVTIPAGAEVTSDPVTFAIEPFKDVAISVYVPDLILHPTEHASTRQTNYISSVGAGDLTAQSAGAGFQSTTSDGAAQGWYFLDGLDVIAPGATGAVVAFGDSITDGYQASGTAVLGSEVLSTADLNDRYPDFLARRLIQARMALSVLNEGIGNNELLGSWIGGIAPTGGVSGLSRFGSDVVNQPGVSDVIVLEGINDLAQKAASAWRLIAGYEQLIAEAHAAGIKIQLGTITPVSGATLPDASAVEANREQVNAWIRSQHLSDGIVDFDAAVRDPSDPDRILPADDGGDHVHMSPVGYGAMAAAVPLKLLGRARCGG